VLAAAALHAASGDLARAQTLLEASIDRLPHGSLRARALQSVGQLHVRRSSFNDAIRCAFEALREAGEDKVLAAEIELDLAYGIGSLGDIAGGATHARQAVALADAGAPAALTAKVLAASAMMQFLCGDGLASAVVERAVALEEPRAQGPLQMRPSYIHAILLIWSGRPAEALPVLYRLRGELIETGSDSELPLLSVFIVWALLWCGDVAQAVAVADRAAQTASLLDDRLAVALARSAGALARAYAGQTELARRDAAHAAALFDELQYRPGAIWPPWALGFLELSLGNPDGAHAVLGPLAHIFGAAPGDPVLSVFMPDEIEALIDLGQADRAEELLASFEARARSVERAWALGAAARCRGLLLAARGDLDRALTAFEEALRWHARSPMPFARARTCLELGRVQRRRKQKRQARVALEDALTAFERVGTPLWADRARAELARVRTRTSRPGLTATEERIARLAAEGLTNRAIAERAFVTVNTVEANLTRVYRKLRISSRAQLARALGDPLDPIS
jgi:DNA-binding CsgD family transcriptional regulator